MNQAQDRGVPPSEAPLCGENDGQTKAQRIHQRPEPDPQPGPEPSVSMKRSQSMENLRNFSDGRNFSVSCSSHQQREENQESSEVPTGPSDQQHQTHLDSIFMLLENILTFVKNELKIQKVVSSDYPECLEKEGEEVLDEEQRRSREAFVTISVHFLRRLKQQQQEELADHLQSRLLAPVCQGELQSNRKKFQCVFEEIAKAEHTILLNAAPVA